MKLIQKIQKFFFQSKDEILFRKGRIVSSHQLNEIFSTDKFPQFKELPSFANFSYLVYGEINRQSVNISKSIERIPDGWLHLEDTPNVQKKQKGVYLSGLKYMVFYNAEMALAVVAFRGTRFKKWQDWVANANPVTRHIPYVHSHYAQTIELVPDIVQYLQSKYGKNVEIVTTGHSLGGGLAQQALYASAEIHSCFVFASSPLTGYRSIPKVDRNKNKKGTFIARLFEHGEILAYLRFLLRKFVRISESDPEIVEIRFNFMRAKSPISEHSMKKIRDSIVQQVNEAVEPKVVNKNAKKEKQQMEEIV